VSCAACGADAEREKLRKAGIPILECGRCGLAFWRPPEDFRPESTYDASYFRDPGARHGYDDYGDHEAPLRQNFARRLGHLPRPREGARLLDVGAAFGFAVAEARAAGWSAIGVEVSPAAARSASQWAEGGIAVASALALPFPSASFDAVTLWDVIEHLPDPNTALAEVARLLRPGGTLALTTGDVGSLAARISGSRWHLYTLPEHLFFFTRQSLELLLARHGLRVRSIRAEGAVFTLGYLVERLRKTLLERPARQPAGFPGAGLRIPVNLFDVLTVQAEKVAA